MPVIKSAKKQMRQNKKRKLRNYPLKSEMKSLIKTEMQYIKEGKVEEASTFLPKVYSIIDTACKKNLIKKNNASRKKSSLAQKLNELQKGGGNVKMASDEVESRDSSSVKEDVEESAETNAENAETPK